MSVEGELNGTLQAILGLFLLCWRPHGDGKAGRRGRNARFLGPHQAQLGVHLLSSFLNCT